MEWRRGRGGTGEVSPPVRSLVSKKGGGKNGRGGGGTWSRVWTGLARGRGGGLQKDSSCPTERSPLGVEARDEPLSMLSEPELWCCCSEPTLDVMVDEDVDEERVFSLKSVMMTVTLPTVMASCWAVLRSMFFSLGLGASKRRGERADSQKGSCRDEQQAAPQITQQQSEPAHRKWEWAFRVKDHL